MLTVKSTGRPTGFRCDDGTLRSRNDGRIDESSLTDVEHWQALLFEKNRPRIKNPSQRFEIVRHLSISTTKNTKTTKNLTLLINVLRVNFFFKMLCFEYHYRISIELTRNQLIIHGFCGAFTDATDIIGKLSLRRSRVPYEELFLIYTHVYMV